MRNNKTAEAKKKKKNSLPFSFLAVINEPRDIRYEPWSLTHKYHTVCKSTITDMVTKTNYGATKDKFIIKRPERDNPPQILNKTIYIYIYI
jgi:hypothetical protein